MLDFGGDDRAHLLFGNAWFLDRPEIIDVFGPGTKVGDPLTAQKPCIENPRVIVAYFPSASSSRHADRDGQFVKDVSHEVH